MYHLSQFFVLLVVCLSAQSSGSAPAYPSDENADCLESIKQLKEENADSLERIKQLEDKLEQLQTNFAEQPLKNVDGEDHSIRKRNVIAQTNEIIGKPAAGAVYTRWGRTTCGKTSSVIYTGYAGSTSYLLTGGGVNYQCLPPQPDHGKSYGGGYFSPISGAEYETNDASVFPNSPHDQNVPCARCLTSGRTAVMMYPAKRNCPDGWDKEYEGYLMTAYYTHAHPSTFECVDGEPEYVTGENANTNGALFYFVKPDCEGSGDTRHCPPYNVNNPLTCVVCSK